MSDDRIDPEDRREIAARLRAADGVFLGLDFDGTLAPIEEDPDRPTITPAARSAVTRFTARPDAAVAVISGRALSDLRPRVGLEDVVYAGNHGLELDRERDADPLDRGVDHPVGEEHRPAIRRTVHRLHDRVDDVPGLAIEDKGQTATVHVRNAPDDRVEEVRSAVKRAVREADADLRMSSGKAVFEIRPDVDWDKGATMDHLSETVPDGWLSMYVGDDVTDEDAFRAIGPDGIGVLVGDRAATAADVRLPGQDAVPTLLNWVADSLIGHPRTARVETCQTTVRGGVRTARLRPSNRHRAGDG